MAESVHAPAHPKLRPDLKISRQVSKENVGYVVKDPLKGEYFRFAEEEWRIISLFDGTRSLEQIAAHYNSLHPDDPIEAATVKEFQGTLNSMHLLAKSKADMNVMLVEKMREMRQSQLLAKKGSLFYKRFPLVDPDRFFDKIIPRIGYFWTKRFFALSLSIMLLACVLVGFNWDQFTNGVYEVFSFSQLSVWNLLFLWVTIYTVIAIHELGHGLTCKYYGGEVHEIGFLLLFFQPCLYANVNDAWLFDKKWKQVMVTIAGGYIEFFVGALFAILWVVTNPNTMVNVLSLQVMTICSISTVAFNFNPLVKLDGYYLLADALEIPNLRDSSFDYMKYLFSRYVFRKDLPDHESTLREKRIYFLYGGLATFWVTSLTFGLYFMAKDLLVQHLFGLGVILSFWVGWKVLGGHMKKIGVFLFKLYMENKELVHSRKGKAWIGGIAAAVLLIAFFPLSYPVAGSCALEAKTSLILRAKTDGIIRKFHLQDGDMLTQDGAIVELENSSLETDVEITSSAVAKLEYKLKASLVDNVANQAGLLREFAAKRASLQRAKEKLAGLVLKAPSLGASNGSPSGRGLTIISCPDQIRKLNTSVREGDEVCRIEEIQQMKAIVNVPEHQVGYIEVGNPVRFKLKSRPFKTYAGRVNRIRDLGTPDPLNPKAKLYSAELLIDNTGDLRAGMTGSAKILTPSVPLVQFLARKASHFFRLDLFF